MVSISQEIRGAVRDSLRRAGKAPRLNEQIDAIVARRRSGSIAAQSSTPASLGGSNEAAKATAKIADAPLKTLRDLGLVDRKDGPADSQRPPERSENSVLAGLRKLGLLASDCDEPGK